MNSLLNWFQLYCFERRLVVLLFPCHLRGGSEGQGVDDYYRVCRPGCGAGAHRSLQGVTPVLGGCCGLPTSDRDPLRFGIGFLAIPVRAGPHGRRLGGDERPRPGPIRVGVRPGGPGEASSLHQAVEVSSSERLRDSSEGEL